MAVMKNITESVLAQLKNESKKKGVSLQQLLNLFCQEEFIRRLSKSNYKENLILKGGLLLYSISEFNFEGRKLQEALYETLTNREDHMSRNFTCKFK